MFCIPCVTRMCVALIRVITYLKSASQYRVTVGFPAEKSQGILVSFPVSAILLSPSSLPCVGWWITCQCLLNRCVWTKSIFKNNTPKSLPEVGGFGEDLHTVRPRNSTIATVNYVFCYFCDMSNIWTHTGLPSMRSWRLTQMKVTEHMYEVDDMLHNLTKSSVTKHWSKTAVTLN